MVIDYPNSKVCLTGKCSTGHSRVVIDLTWGGGLCSLFSKSGESVGA